MKQARLVESHAVLATAIRRAVVTRASNLVLLLATTIWHLERNIPFFFCNTCMLSLCAVSEQELVAVGSEADSRGRAWEEADDMGREGPGLGSAALEAVDNGIEDVVAHPATVSIETLLVDFWNTHIVVACRRGMAVSWLSLRLSSPLLRWRICVRR